MSEPKQIVIFSVGLLGASIAAGLKKSNFDGIISGVSGEKNLADAKSAGTIDAGFSYEEFFADKDGVLSECDILFLCSPIEKIKETIITLSKLQLKNQMLITDVGSTKKEIFETAKEFLPQNIKFIAGHPMAGSEKSGASFAEPFLFRDAIWVLYSQYIDDAKNFGTFLEKYLGCKTKFIAPDIHDKITAAVSHVPHLIAVALVNAVEKTDRKIEGTLELAAGGFKSMTRIASSPYYMWDGIYKSNRDENIKFLDGFLDELMQLRAALSSENPSLKEYFNSAAATRSKLF